MGIITHMNLAHGRRRFGGNYCLQPESVGFPKPGSRLSN